MNEHGRDDHGQPHTSHYPDALTDRILGERLSHFFHEQAKEVHFTPELRERVMSRLSARRTRRQPRAMLVVAFACAAFLMLALGFSSYLSQLMQPVAPAQVQYALLKEMNVSPELARGGQLASVDPTEQRVIYQPAGQHGVFYIASLNDPATNNTLAMRYARGMAWSPDGSALVATVSPAGSSIPLLALVPVGQYMHLLGHDALAASWSPKDKQQITYALQANGQTQIWSTNRDGQANKLLATMPLSLLIKSLSWSPDGRYLALVVSATTSPTHEALDQPARSIYVVDMQTQRMSTFTAPVGSSIGNVEWSPNGKNVAYEQLDAQGKSILQVESIAQSGHRSTITPRNHLLGWSWSPDGRALVYSDGGALQAYVFHGQQITFQHSASRLVSPFWLKNGTILCLHVKQNANTLELLSPQSK